MMTLLRSNILHRARRVLLACLLITGMIAATAWAQRTRRVSQGPRAIGVLQVDSKGRARLIPISLFIGGKFYDAGLYRATPRPFALQPETVYEGEQNGESVGLFTITGAQQTNQGWIGLGQWRLNSAEEETKKPAKAAPAPVDTLDEPPVLRRPGAQNETPQAQPPANAGAKPQAAPAPQASAKPQPPTPEVEEDSSRPVLRRGKPTAPEPQDAQPVSNPKLADVPRSAGPAAARQESGGPPAPPPSLQTLTAVSDAKGPEPHSYKYLMSPAEEQKYRGLMAELALNDVRKFAAARPQFRLDGALDNVQFSALDPNSNNEAVFIFSGSVPQLPAAARPGTPPSTRYFVTAVARVDLYGALRPLFSQVTDSSHFDVYPRLELLGAVDADGNGSGELLFRQYQDRGSSYALYRVGMDRLWPLLETAPTRD